MRSQCLRAFAQLPRAGIAHPQGSESRSPFASHRARECARQLFVYTWKGSFATWAVEKNERAGTADLCKTRERRAVCTVNRHAQQQLNARRVGWQGRNIAASAAVVQTRSFGTARPMWHSKKNEDLARELNQKGLDRAEEEVSQTMEGLKEKQVRSPWTREGSQEPPVERQRSAGAMTKGKLLTTPSRLLKLIVPLTTLDTNSDRKDIEPLALLVHPQQPLSYLERLIQAEVPPIKDAKGNDKPPQIWFRAENSADDVILPKHADKAAVNEHEADAEKDPELAAADKEDPESTDGKESGGDAVSESESASRTPGSAHKTSSAHATAIRGKPGEGGVETYSGLGRESPHDHNPHTKDFVRWSSSTEVGDFIRDAARGKEFIIEFEGGEEIGIGVPSFRDRTHYLRMRLRKAAKQIASMAEIKNECDRAAHKGAQRVALAGFGLMVGWWALVYKLTFDTRYGWDTMEPVTYLVGLSTIMGGYLWFLYHNREVSYRSALNYTISRRQRKLYQQRGFDIEKWEELVEMGKTLRKEIKAVAEEYDVDWDEKEDEQDERVTEALDEREEESNKRKRRKKKEDEDDD